MISRLCVNIVIEQTSDERFLFCTKLDPIPALELERQPYEVVNHNVGDFYTGFSEHINLPRNVKTART